MGLCSTFCSLGTKCYAVLIVFPVHFRLCCVCSLSGFCAGDLRFECMQRRQPPDRDHKEADHSHAHAHAHSGLHEFSGEYFVDEGASTATRLIAVAVVVIPLLLAFIAYRVLYK